MMNHLVANQIRKWEFRKSTHYSDKLLVKIEKAAKTIENKKSVCIRGARGINHKRSFELLLNRVYF